MEDTLADIKLSIQEIRSTMKILQQALLNDYNDIEKCDIENCIEIMIKKTNESILKIENAENKINYN